MGIDRDTWLEREVEREGEVDEVEVVRMMMMEVEVWVSSS